MCEEDIPALERLIQKNIPLLGDVRQALVLSPCGQEQAMLSRLFPGAQVSTRSREQWDLMQESTEDVRWDLAVACNTFMYSTDPSRWLENLATWCRYLAIQDNARSRRMPDRYCGWGPGGDGDCSRFSVSTHGVLGMTDPGLSVYDFSRCAHPVVDGAPYLGGMKFAVILKLQ